MPTDVASSRLDAARQSILGAFPGQTGLRPAYLFEPDDSAAYRVTACAEGLPPIEPGHAFSPRSLLIRWLRVNDKYLPIPDDIGVFAALDARSRGLLTSPGIAGCAPLVFERELAGWVAFVGPVDSRRSTRTPDVSAAKRCAKSLRDEVLSSLARRRTELVERTNRLGLAGEMAASIAHEVRNPLALIRSNVQCLLEDIGSSGPFADQLVKILQQVDRAQLRLRGLTGAGPRPAGEHVPFDLSTIIDEALDYCRPHARQMGVTLSASAGRAVVSGNPQELHQVLVNLCLNACQASRTGATVTIDVVASPAGTVAIRVTDTGQGIPDEVLTRIFDPFFSTKTEGGGLGLTICRDILSRHLGTIGVEKTGAGGTTMLVTFPPGRT